MNQTIQTTGSCLCGAVTITAKAASNNVGACHCSMCRTWTGGPLMAIDCQDQVEITGDDNVSIFNSSEWAERGFCSQCGTHLFYRLKPNNQYIIPAGLLDDQGNRHFDHQIFIEEKPDYYTFANDTKNMTGQEVFEQFSGES